MSVEVEAVGANPVKLWGLTMEERLRRMARACKPAVPAGESVLVNLRFAFDPAWLQLVASSAETVVTREGVPVLARVGPGLRGRIRAAMEQDGKLEPLAGVEWIEQERFGEVENKALRKRYQPFMERLTDATRAGIERTSYHASYKGVTDLLTKYLWPEWAFSLTRLAARLGLSPNMVTTIGAILCAAAGITFWHGWYWSGMAAALAFMVLDTVDGKLARCTLTASWWGNLFDHGIDLVHPLLWWWAWGVGLEAYGRPLDERTFKAVMIVLVAGYLAQRLIEGAFILRFGIHIHVWERVDSDFRLVTARRNPNMVILFVSLVLYAPNAGLVAVAVWTLLCCLFHLVRLLQALLARARGRPIESWLR
ncbi:MAG TPA: CDP-alcohol phosphatidyltransferase family protein [Allosphingosinicella sp.]|nr:CDP-alcohol phosphatidyltransferase family protein [Allosphingosinicella sp.]